MPEEELIAKLKRADPCESKLGSIRPRRTSIWVTQCLIQKMKQFQDLGHEVIFLIGDFTGMIGDPSGKSETRKQLTLEEVDKNAETYKEQIFKILDPRKTIIEFNHRWMEKMDAVSMIGLAAKSYRCSHARAGGLQTALSKTAVDQHPRVSLSFDSGLRFRCS